jgi:hypothetical protein
MRVKANRVFSMEHAPCDFLSSDGNGQHESEKQSRLAQNEFAKSGEVAFSRNPFLLRQDADEVTQATSHRRPFTSRREQLTAIAQETTCSPDNAEAACWDLWLEYAAVERFDIFDALNKEDQA